MPKKTSPLNKSNQIYHTLREQIITDQYPGGTFLNEGDLCTQFSVSRTPVREALIRLSQDGFLDLIPNRGAYIPHITMNDIAAICQLRAANEGLAAYLVTRNQPSAAFLKKLVDSITHEERLLSTPDADPVLISREDFNFHSLIMHNCGNKRLTNYLELLDNQMHRLARVNADDYAVENSLRRSLEFHKKVLESIRSGDANAARDHLAEHWWDNLDGYLQRSLSGKLYD